MGKLLTQHEVCEWLQISRQTLHRLRKEGKIVGYRIGGQVRFKEEEIQSWIEQQKE